VLTLEDVHVSYSGSEALRGVDLALSKGELVAVIGPNGAGKSTLLRTISGLVRRSAGKITFDGNDLGAFEPDEIVRRGIIHVPEGRMVLGRMSVRENLLLGAYSGPGEDHTKELGYPRLFPRSRAPEQVAGTPPAASSRCRGRAEG
jgi:branched-chain amino acid transport system ATP-binding protein